MKFRNGKTERFALAFRSGLSLHLYGDKVERPCPAPDTAGEYQLPRLVRDRRPVALRWRWNSSPCRRSSPRRTEYRDRASRRAIGPAPQQDIGPLAAQMVFQEFGCASAIEDGAVQEGAAFGFDAVLLRLRAAGKG